MRKGEGGERKRQKVEREAPNFFFFFKFFSIRMKWSGIKIIENGSGVVIVNFSKSFHSFSKSFHRSKRKKGIENRRGKKFSPPASPPSTLHRDNHRHFITSFSPLKSTIKYYFLVLYPENFLLLVSHPPFASNFLFFSFISI